MAIAASVKELAEQQSEQLAKSFAGILQSVVPDVTKSLAKTTQSFQKALLTGSNQKIQKSYGDLSKFLKTFDVNISDLGEGFRDTEKVFKSLTDQFADTDEKIQGLREKNIFAEKELFINKKNNNLEVRATILTDQQLFEKRKNLLAKEKELKEEEKDYLDQIRRFQSGEDTLSKSKKANLLKNFQNNQDEIKNTEELKKLYSGKGGLAVNLLDRFERSLDDNAPSFLIAAFAPIIDIARQFQKTFGLLVSGIKMTAEFIGGLSESFNSVKKSFSKTMTSIGGGLKSFGKSIKMASLGLLTFVKRIVLAGVALLMGIITPLLPIIIPMLKFAGIVALVVAKLYLFQKGLAALTDWFKNSWLGKKLGLDDKSQEKKDKQGLEGEKDSLEGEKDKQDSSPSSRPGPITSALGSRPGMSEDLSKLEWDNEKKQYVKPKVIAEKPLMPVNTMATTNKSAIKRQEALKKFDEEAYIKSSEEQHGSFLDPSELTDREKFKFMRTGKTPSPDDDGEKVVPPSPSIAKKIEKPTPIKKDLKGEGTSSSNVTTVVNNQPSNSSTQVSNTSVLSPINVSSGDNYFDRQANASNF